MIVERPKVCLLSSAIKIPDVIAELAKEKPLSIVMRNLNRLMESAADRALGRCALASSRLSRRLGRC